MSLILDALNRSRNDSDPVPGIGTRHDAEIEPAVPRWRNYLPWGGLLVALVVIAALLFEREDSAGGRVATLSPAQPAPGPAAVPAPGVPPTPTQPAAQSTSSEKTSETSSTVGAGVGTVKAVSAPAAAVGEAAAATAEVNPEVAQLYQRPVEESSEPVTAAAEESTATPVAEETTAPPTAREEKIDIEQLVLQAQEDMQNARLEEHSAPFISDLSQQTKDDIPTVYYQRHDYSGVAGQSRVVLNGESMGRGGSPVPGMKVVEILPDSVVLNYRGTEFRLRALNSWVNL